MKWLFIFIFCLLAIILLLTFGCTSQTNNNKQKILTTSFFPVTEMTKEVVKDEFIVYSLVPPGIEPHDYEPTSRDIKRLENAEAYFILGAEGLEFENQATKDLSYFQNKTFRVSKNVETIQTNGKTDPHVWLSPKRMKTIVGNIKDIIAKIDPQKKRFYEDNAGQLKIRLDDLDERYTDGLSGCNKSIILTSHAAFGYLVADYNLSQIGISGLEPEAEPTPNQIREFIDIIKLHNLKYIFYEKLADPRIPRTIAVEAGARILELDPLEGSKERKSYFELMERNLQNLRLALECN